MPKKIKVIVTGGAGFIGSHLTDFLIKKGFEVHVIDNLVSGKKEKVNSKAVLHVLDIRNLEDIKPVFKGTRCVFHLAALPRVQPSIVDPKTSHEVNTAGTLNVLIAAKDSKVKRLVYSASSSAYGNQKKFPLKENFKAEPLSPYGLQKYVGELHCRLFSFLYGIETVSLRYFNVYGPGAATDGAYALVIGRFLEQKKSQKPLTIVPDGNQSRDFTHVYDIVNANFLAMESKKVGKGEIINIGGGKNYSVNKIARLIGGPTVFVEPRVEPKKTLADITLAKKLLSWRPKVKFEDGIKELKNLYGI